VNLSAPEPAAPDLARSGVTTGKAGPDSGRATVWVVSDVHYASAAEKARGLPEWTLTMNPALRLLIWGLRRYLWLRDPMSHNGLLDQFLATPGAPDWVVANGDYSCDSAYVGVSDDATRSSVVECLHLLRQRFGDRLLVTWGDHELGKVSLVGGRGGLRLESWRRAQTDLGLRPFWRLDLGRYPLLGVVSSLVALPVFEPETLPEERPEWWRLREAHLAEISAAFISLPPGQRVLLFCHDPSALPWLGRLEPVQQKLDQIEQTFIGHLHSRLFLWKSQRLAGMPAIRWLGNSIRRMSEALHEARRWRPFHPRLCPSLSGIELLKDGGFYSVELDLAGRTPARFQLHPIRHPR